MMSVSNASSMYNKTPIDLTKHSFCHIAQSTQKRILNDDGFLWVA